MWASALGGMPWCSLWRFFPAVRSGFGGSACKDGSMCTEDWNSGIDRIVSRFKELIDDLDLILGSSFPPPPDFPYKNFLRNNWFTQEVKENRSGLEHSPARRQSFKMNMINISRPTADPCKYIRDKLLTITMIEGDKFYFHGTLACHVPSILEGGIRLQHGKRKQDFSHGHGFYVTENPKQAVKRAQKLIKMSETSPRKAVVVYKIGQAMQTEEGVLSLYGHGKKRLWWAIVKHFRCGENNQDLKRQLAGIKVIEGPVSFLPGRNHTQFCIRSEEYANRFGRLENIPFVIFF